MQNLVMRYMRFSRGIGPISVVQSSVRHQSGYKMLLELIDSLNTERAYSVIQLSKTHEGLSDWEGWGRGVAVYLDEN